MGTTVSKTTNAVKIKTETLNKSVTDIIQKNSSSIASSNTNIQTLKIRIINSKITGDIKQTASISTSSEVTGTLIASTASSVLSNIAGAIEADIKNQASTSNESGAAGTSVSVTKNSTDIEGAVHNAVEQKITQENYNAVVASVLNLQTGEITIDGSIVHGDITQTGSIVSNLIAQSLISSVITTANDNLLAGGSKTKLVQSSDTKNKGPSETNMIVMAIICCICCMMSVMSLYAAMKMEGD
jgi:hypothetical protein